MKQNDNLGPDLLTKIRSCYTVMIINMLDTYGMDSDQSISSEIPQIKVIPFWQIFLHAIWR